MCGKGDRGEEGMEGLQGKSLGRQRSSMQTDKRHYDRAEEGGMKEGRSV